MPSSVLPIHVGSHFHRANGGVRGNVVGRDTNQTRGEWYVRRAKDKSPPTVPMDVQDQVESGVAAKQSFIDHCLVACAILYPELGRLQNEGFLDTRRIYYLPPGLHTLPERLEEQLASQLQRALKVCPPEMITVVQGAKCFVSMDDPYRRIDDIINEQAQGIRRVQADYGYDMLVNKEQRDQIAVGGDEGRVLWFTPGWLQNWKTIYQRYLGWNRADANANFPGYYDEIVVLDALNVAEIYQAEEAEKILELFDWTDLQVRFHLINLDRLKGLLLDALNDRGER